MPNGDKILKAASALADELTDDIFLAKTREEHIRVTARANAATELLFLLTELQGEDGGQPLTGLYNIASTTTDVACSNCGDDSATDGYDLCTECLTAAG